MVRKEIARLYVRIANYHAAFIDTLLFRILHYDSYPCLTFSALFSNIVIDW